MDTVVIVDENDRALGTMPRAEAHANGTLHRISVVYLTRNDGHILVQERKDGRFDHSSAGHVDPGETYGQTAARELAEELGIENQRLQKIGKSVSDERREDRAEHIRHIFEIFEGKIKETPHALHPHEVNRVFWADPRDVMRAMEDDKNCEIYTGGFRASLVCFKKNRRR